jgi:uncharacterized protein GlcG (DUF336 family)
MSIELAQRIAMAAGEKAKQFGKEISIAVVDESGHLVYFARGNSCGFISFETAKGKASMAAGFRRPTSSLVEASRENPAFWMEAASKLNGIIGAGGYPITSDGVLIGAIGCGGATSEEDHLCAEAAAAAIST